MTHKTEKTRAMVRFNQNLNERLEGLKVKLNNTTGITKSRGKNPNAPKSPFMSPKKGSIAAIVIAIATDMDRAMVLGMTFRIENCLLFGSANARSRTSFVGCK